jgi:hypothetical protein
MPSTPSAPALVTAFRRLVAPLLILSLLLGGLPGPVSAQSDPVPRDDPRFGAVQSIHAPDRAVQAGVRWERIIFPWAEMQPASPDELRPGYFTDIQIEGQLKRGITLVGVVLYTPGWAATDPEKGASSVPKGLDRPITDKANTWANFIGRLAARYKGKVDSWIIWNEPDLIDPETKVASNWAGSEAEFCQLQKVGYQAIKRANPDAKVLLPGFSYWHAREAGLEPYLKRLLDVAAKDSSAPKNDWYFDGVPLHPYANPLNSYALPQLYRRLLADRKLDKPIWNVESNAVPWDDPIGLLPREPWRVTMEEQANYVIQAFALGLAADVERMSIYKMRDEFAENGQNFGLVREDGSVRPAYTALQTAVRYFSGAEKATYTWDGSRNPPSEEEVRAVVASNKDRYQFVWPGRVSQVAIERDGQRVTVVWNTSRRPLEAQVRATAERATLVDPLGRTDEIAAEDGSYRLYLSAARTNTEPRDKSLTMVGGQPWLIVEAIGGNPRSSQPPRVEDGLYFKETGFSIANGRFVEYFQGHGGKSTFGLPISREFDLYGARTQIFQRQVMQLTPDGDVQTLNLLDDLLPYTSINGSVFPAPDPKVKGAAPSPDDPAYASKIVEFVRQQAPDTWQGRAVGFGRTYFNAVTCESDFAGGGCQPELLPLLNLEVWGLPISAPTADPGNDSFVYQRFQRGLMHYDSNCNCTQGLLLGDYFRALITGQGLPKDLEEQASGSPFLRQYDQGRVQGLSRPGDLRRTNLKDAFEPH